MKEKTFEDAATAWGVVLPPEMGEIAGIEPGMCILVNGREIALPWPPLTATELISAVDVATEWELAPGLLPIMGDFHDLACLHYEGAQCKGVTVINDNRATLASFPSVSKFMQALRRCSPEDPLPANAVDRSKSWLNF